MILLTPIQFQNSTTKLQNARTETIRSMLADSELPKRFWAEAISTATYLCNLSQINTVQDKTPYEAWTGNKSNVSHLFIFRCDVYAHVLKSERSKHDSKTRRSIFLWIWTRCKSLQLV